VARILEVNVASSGKDTVGEGDTLRVAVPVPSYLICSVCVSHLIAGPDGVSSCDECVEACAEILEEERATSRSCRMRQGWQLHPPTARVELLALCRRRAPNTPHGRA
jgi:ClpX C4-type zinc finger